MDTRVGPASRREARLNSEDASQLLRDRTFDRANRRVPLPSPPVEVGAVIGQDELHDASRHGASIPRASTRRASYAERSTSSILAIAAPSPLRCPSFRIRV